MGTPERVVIGECELWRGDCREVLADVRADALITDPPYGVNLGSHASAKEKRRGHLRKQAYATYEDTLENLECIVIPAIQTALKQVKRGSIFCAGNRIQSYPQADAVGGIYCPTGVGRTAWGFACFLPMLLYGTCPHNHRGSRHTVLYSTHPGMHVTGEDRIAHPCPKPLAWMLWLVDRVSVSGEIVLDPFAGSFTTGVACVQLGRRFVGIELEPSYWELGCRRIEEDYRQPALFPPPAPPAQQQALFTGGRTR